MTFHSHFVYIVPKVRKLTGLHQGDFTSSYRLAIVVITGVFPLGHPPLTCEKSRTGQKNATLEKLHQLFSMFPCYIHNKQHN